MDQSKSIKGGDDKTNPPSAKSEIVLPPRTFTVEFMVGVFAFVGIVTIGYLSVGLGGVRMFDNNRYELRVKFDNISGLKNGASVEIAGVPIGEVVGIELADPEAVVIMKIHNETRIKDDDIFMVRTKGIIGDRYVKVSRGASETYVEPGSVVPEKGESIVDIEDLIGKFVHNFGDKSEGE